MGYSLEEIIMAKPEVTITVDSVGKKYKKALSAFTTWQNASHQATMEAFAEVVNGSLEFLQPTRDFLQKLIAIRTKKDTDVVGFTAYLTEVLGYGVNESADGVVVLTYDSQEKAEDMLARVKDVGPWYEYKNKKLLKSPSLPNVEGNVARGLLVGSITEKEVDAWVDGLKASIFAKKSDKKVVKWAEEYAAQEGISL